MSGFEMADIVGGLVLVGGYAVLTFAVPLPVRSLANPSFLSQNLTFIVFHGILVKSQRYGGMAFFGLLALLQIYAYVVAPALQARWPKDMTLPRWFRQVWTGRGVSVTTALATALAGVYFLCRWLWAVPTPGVP